jgi:protein-S-isoprenylcysteine O-methyltransferase Ste14
MGISGFSAAPRLKVFRLPRRGSLRSGGSLLLLGPPDPGRNWSGTVTLKKDHELIQGGPYKLARHPMYTGILTGLFGVALTVGQVGNFLGVALLTFAMIRKMGMEEMYLQSHFNAKYLNYSKKVKRLIPFIY